MIAENIRPAPGLDLEQIDQSLEAATLLRSSEEKFAQDYREGYAFGRKEDQRRLDAFTLGLLDALAEVIGPHRETLSLLVYVHAVQRLGPGARARNWMRYLLDLDSELRLKAYVAAGRKLVLRSALGAPAEVGGFARLLEAELHDTRPANHPDAWDQGPTA